MCINASKTEFMVCGDRRQLTRFETSPSVTFMGEQLKCTERVKSLGVMVDRGLSWEHHVKLVHDRCFGILIGLNNVKHLLPRDLLPRIIDALVITHIRYALQVYGNAGKELMKKIQKVLNFAARVISGRRKSDHISDVMSQMGWLDVHQMTDYADLTLLLKVLTTERPVMLAAQLSFNRECASRITRQSDHLALPKPRTNHGKKTFIYRASQLYNKHCAPKYDIDKCSQATLKKFVREAVRNV